MGVIYELVLPMAILVLTRPMEASLRFLSQIEAQVGFKINSIISPLLEIVEVPASIKTERKALILTSANGVAGAKRLGFAIGTRAFCVGAKTAETASKAGFESISADGAADDLVAMIASMKPHYPLVHVHGEHIIGQVVERLNGLGFNCEGVVTYRQMTCAPSEQLLRALAGNEPLLVPLFSPRSSLVFGLIPELRAPLHVIAMSQAVAAEVSDLGVDTVRVVDKPDAQSMVAATCHRLFQLLDPSVA